MKERLDIILVDRRFVESRSKAQWLIKNGFVYVNSMKILKPGKRIDHLHEIKLKKNFPYVGRGGIKLEAALKEFKIDVSNKICVDIGASIGGFTDCLLKHGATKVYAVDTATDLLHPSLKCEKMIEKVIPLLGVDARKLKKLDMKVNLITIDITFTSLRAILPNVKNFLDLKGDVITLIKPIFETDFQEQEKFKIVQDRFELKKILNNIISWSKSYGLIPFGIMKSPLLGKGGSIEFFIHFKLDMNKPNYDYNYKEKIEYILDKKKDKNLLL